MTEEAEGHVYLALFVRLSITLEANVTREYYIMYKPICFGTLHLWCAYQTNVPSLLITSPRNNK